MSVRDPGPRRHLPRPSGHVCTHQSAAHDVLAALTRIAIDGTVIMPTADAVNWWRGEIDGVPIRVGLAELDRLGLIAVAVSECDEVRFELFPEGGS